MARVQRAQPASPFCVPFIGGKFRIGASCRYVADGLVTHNCWYAVRKGKTGHWEGGRSQTTVWQIPHRRNDTGHGTEKPVECMKRPIENNSSPGQAVYEPF